MKNLNPLFEKHNYFKTKSFKSTIPELGMGTAIRGAIGGLSGLVIGDLTGRFVSKNELDPEKRRKIINKHRLIGAGLGATGYAGYGLYDDIKDNIKSHKAGIRYHIKDYKRSKKEFFDFKDRINVAQKELDNSKIEYAELEKQYSDPNLNKLSKKALDWKMYNLRFKMRGLRDNIEYLEANLKFCKRDMEGNMDVLKNSFK